MIRKLVTVFFCLAFTLCWGCVQPGFLSSKPMPETVPVAHYLDKEGGARAHEHAGDNPASRYYVNPDYYHMKPDDQAIIIKNFRTYQQTSEWSCGPSSALMVLWHLGVTSRTEKDIAYEMRTHCDSQNPESQPGSAKRFGDYGTSIRKMVEFFEKIPGLAVVDTSYRSSYTDKDLIRDDDPAFPLSMLGNFRGKFSPLSLYTAENGNPDARPVENAAESYFVKWLTSHLMAGRPILVECADWGGHWMVLIGYDNNGTPFIGDDILIFADPYDTSDHWQDGYFCNSLERWFYQWNDMRIALKPYQLQPYLVVGVKPQAEQ